MISIGNRAKATTPAGESENTNHGKITSIPNGNSTITKSSANATTPSATSGNSTSNATTTPKPTPTKTQLMLPPHQSPLLQRAQLMLPPHQSPVLQHQQLLLLMVSSVYRRMAPIAYLPTLLLNLASHLRSMAQVEIRQKLRYEF